MVKYAKVPDFPEYRVSTSGDVQSHKWGYWHSLAQQTLPPQAGRPGYKRVKLNKDGKTYFRLVHRLVLEAFVGPCPEGCEARHFPDSNPQNNHLSNLSWSSLSTNQLDRLKDKTDIRGTKNHNNYNLTEEKVIRIRELHEQGVSYTRLAKRFQTSRSNAKAICKRRSWKYI